MSKIIAVDLDGTLAHYDGWKGNAHIGDPIPKMVYYVREWVAHGDKVVLFTSRLDTENPDYVLRVIFNWLKEHNIPIEEITCTKRKEFSEIWDDRAYRVERNTGELEIGTTFVTKEKPVKNSVLQAQVGGSHYKDMAIQPVQFSHANNLGCMEASVVKYISRHKIKNGLDDIKKAIHCLEIIMELQYNEQYIS